MSYLNKQIQVLFYFLTSPTQSKHYHPLWQKLERSLFLEKANTDYLPYFVYIELSYIQKTRRYSYVFKKKNL